MSSARWNSATRRALLGVALVLTASRAAIADPARLICDWDGGDAIVQDEPTIIELNQAQSSVSVHFSAYTIPALRSHVAAVSIGPLLALFGNDMVTFRNDGLNRHEMTYGAFSLNRITGAFIQIRSNYRWTCHSGQEHF